MAEIFINKISLLTELTNDIFKFIEKAHSLRINSQFRPEDPNYKIWHGNREIQLRIFFQKNVKLSFILSTLMQIKNLGSRKQSMKVMQNTEFFYIHQIGLT